MIKCRTCFVDQPEKSFQYYSEQNGRRVHTVCQDCYSISMEKNGHETGASWVKLTEERMKGNKKDWYTGGDYYHAHKVSI